jgi:hypothetical protein
MFERTNEYQKLLHKNELMKEATKRFLDKLTSPLDIYMSGFLDINTKALNYLLELDLNSFDMIPTASGNIYYEFTIVGRTDSFICEIRQDMFTKIDRILDGESHKSSGDMRMTFDHLVSFLRK